MKKAIWWAQAGLALVLTLTIIGISVVGTLAFRPLYYHDMETLELSAYTGLSEEEIREIAETVAEDPVFEYSVYKAVSDDGKDEKQSHMENLSNGDVVTLNVTISDEKQDLLSEKGFSLAFDCNPLEMTVKGPHYLVRADQRHVTLNEAGKEQWLEESLEPFPRYEEMLHSFAAMVRGEKENPWSLDYELALFKIILACCGM